MPWDGAVMVEHPEPNELRPTSELELRFIRLLFLRARSCTRQRPQRLDPYINSSVPNTDRGTSAGVNRFHRRKICFLRRVGDD